MLVKGPFTIKWGDNTLVGVEELDIAYEQGSDDYETIQGQVYEVEGPIKAGATLTLLESDVPSLAAILPQYFVANGAQLSTGETVQHADGAIDLYAGVCTTNTVYNNLDITSCSNPGHVVRLVRARTKVEDVEIDSKLRKVMVKFVGEPASGDGSLQFFRAGKIATVS